MAFRITIDTTLTCLSQPIFTLHRNLISSHGTALVNLVNAIGHALLNFPELVEAYLAVYKQHADEEPTEEDKTDHQRAFRTFVLTTGAEIDTVGPRNHIPGLYARWSPPRASQRHTIEVDESLLAALADTGTPDMRFLFVVCIIHEMGHAYSYFIRQRKRFGSHSSVCTSVHCSVGSRRDKIPIPQQGLPSSWIPRGEAGYVVEDRWLGGTLVCRIDTGQDWRYDWMGQRDLVKGFEVLNEHENSKVQMKDATTYTIGL